MNSDATNAGPMLAADWLLLALVVSLAFPKPALDYPILATDLIFVALAIFGGIEVLRGRRRVQWRAPFTVLVVYVGSLAPSLLATPDLRASLIKLAAAGYLAALAGATALLVTDEKRLRRLILTWLAASAVVALLAPLGVLAFYAGGPALVRDFTMFSLGSLPAGDYPRLALSFFNANMACDYLTLSLGFLFAARYCGWIGRGPAALLIAGIAFACLMTLSPGLGGIALLAGLWLWLEQRNPRPAVASAALAAGVGAAILFALALAVTIFPYADATMIASLPGGAVLAAAPRWATWAAAAQEWARHPFIGHGIGIDAVAVRVVDPSGSPHDLTDAHNMFLNVGAQAGIVGFAGLIVLTVMAFRLTGPLRLASKADALRLGVGLSFLDAFVYQGLGGSFEDARHVWVALGLMIALPTISRADGNNRRAGAPSPD